MGLSPGWLGRLDGFTEERLGFGFLLYLFDFEISQTYGKSCKNSSKNSCMLFAQILEHFMTFASSLFVFFVNV